MKILNLVLGDQTKIKNAWNEDKILKVEFLSNHWSDLPQISSIRPPTRPIAEVWNKLHLRYVYLNIFSMNMALDILRLE